MPAKKRVSEEKKGHEQKNVRFIVYTDGGCLLNPGGVGAYGVVVIDCETGEYNEYAQAFEHTTNNRMELMGVIAALEHIRAVAPGAAADIFSDSMYVVNLVKHEPGDRYTNQDLWRRYDQASSGLDLAYAWVRGHNGDEYNERCDELATEAMHRADCIPDRGYSGPIRNAVSRPRPPVGSVPGTAGGAMAVRISVPQQFEDHGDADSASRYSALYRVNPSCASRILAFYDNGSHRFKDFVELKTGGADPWSRVSGEDLVAKVSPEASSAAAMYLRDEKQLLSCLKWRCRGLALSDAIRKVLVDTEVASNCTRYR